MACAARATRNSLFPPSSDFAVLGKGEVRRLRAYRASEGKRGLPGEQFYDNVSGKETRLKRLIAIAMLILLTLSCTVRALAQTDPFLGTWKLNVKKSKFVPGPPRKNETRIVVTGPFGMKVSVDRLNGDGSTQRFEYTSNLDGKSYPITGQGPYGADSIAANLTAPNTIQSTLKRDGKVVATATTMVSSDGKVLTITTKGTDVNGKQFTNVGVYDK
jgi:hypothetical protein